MNACSAKRSVVQRGRVLQFSLGGILGKITISSLVRLEFRGYSVCLRATTQYLRTSIIRMVRYILDDRTEEDKFSAEYSIEYTWPCITSDYEKNSVSLGFSPLSMAQRGGNIFRRSKYYDEQMRFVIPASA